MGQINKDWHVQNKMPTKPSREERGKWHAEHVEVCGCRAPSLAEQELIEEYLAEHGA